MQDALTQAKDRVQRYWNVDGLHEIAVAVLFLLTAAWVWATDVSPVSLPWRRVLGIAFPFMLCGGILAEKHVVRAIRERLTFRRTGYVEFREPTRKLRAASAAIGLGVAVLLVFLVAKRRTEGLEVFLVPGLGALVGLFTGWLGWRQGPRRLLLIAAASVLAGTSIGYAGMAMSAGMAAYYTAMGAVMLLSGAFTLWQYLRMSPEPEEE